MLVMNAGKFIYDRIYNAFCFKYLYFLFISLRWNHNKYKFQVLYSYSLLLKKYVHNDLPIIFIVIKLLKSYELIIFIPYKLNINPKWFIFNYDQNPITITGYLMPFLFHVCNCWALSQNAIQILSKY